MFQTLFLKQELSKFGIPTETQVADIRSVCKPPRGTRQNGLWVEDTGALCTYSKNLDYGNCTYTVKTTFAISRTCRVYEAILLTAIIFYFATINSDFCLFLQWIYRTVQTMRETLLSDVDEILQFFRSIFALSPRLNKLRYIPFFLISYNNTQNLKP